eukprot:TRINITY_DN9104_c0_g1_i1.p1 TRINITY_DN9104_c0_g1~~TRINITY_DN9104_c0_g1_i1.p1  ORF type:complete len:1072 (+),score=246.31 TRINITY_DN9104_c0_g1_i1:149-3364(+)
MEPAGKAAGKAGKSGKAKARVVPAPPPKAKGPGKGHAEPLPQWQKPEISKDWQPDRVVNWKPINKTQLQGSVWEQVHDALGDKSTPAQLSEALLSRFMRKASEAAENQQSKKPGVRDVGQWKPERTRLLSSKHALVADIHHALLLRKGVQTSKDLAWILGPGGVDASVDEEHLACAKPISEDNLEALLGLLGAASTEEKKLRDAGSAVEDCAKSEAFLLKLLEIGRLDELQMKVQMGLDMARFSGRAEELKRTLELALSAVWAVIDSKALPLLLEGILLLGNAVNAASKHLGGAVGVTLESLTKLSQTKCIPAKPERGKTKKASSTSHVETALEVLVQHVEQAHPGFINDLADDLNACHEARDCDQSAVSTSVQELTAHVVRVQRFAGSNATDAPDAFSPVRLRHHLEEADHNIEHLKMLLIELDDAAAGMRQWFAEPPSSSLQYMLKALAALRESLPVQKPDASGRVPRPYHQSSMRASGRFARPAEPASPDRTEKVAEKTTAETSEATECTVLAKAAEPEVPAESAPEASADSDETTSEPEQLEELPRHLQMGAPCQVSPPTSVVAQILSFCNGTLWMSWLFDWGDVLRAFSQEQMPAMVFEILQFSDSEGGSDVVQKELNADQAVSNWQCDSAPFKFDVATGRHYVFGVRALLMRHDGQKRSSPLLWASPVSQSVTVDLRCLSTVRSVPSKPALAEAPVLSASSLNKMPRAGRGRVASSLGDFIQSLQAGMTGEQKSKQPTIGSQATSADEMPSTREFAHIESSVASGAWPAAAQARSHDESDTLAASELQNQASAEESLQEAVMPAGLLTKSSGESVGSIVSPGAASTAERSNMQVPAKLEGSKASAAQLAAAQAVALLQGQSCAVAQDDSTPLPSRSTESWESDASIADFDDDSLRYMAEALRQLEEASPAKHSPAGDWPNEQMLGSVASGYQSSTATALFRPSESLKGRSAIDAPRATSIFDDDALENMAQMLTGMRDDSQDTLSPVASQASEFPSSPMCQGSPLLVRAGTDGLVDGNEVLAAAERAYMSRMTCKTCGGSGSVGLFGNKGLGMFTKPCPNCQVGL